MKGGAAPAPATKAVPGEKGMVLVDVASDFVGAITGARYESGERYVDGRDYAENIIQANKSKA